MISMMKHLFCCFLLLAFTGYRAYCQVQDIDVAPVNHDFGEVAVNESFEHSFAVSNEGTEESLVVFSTSLAGENSDEFRIANGGGGFVLNPGAIRLVTIQFNPRTTGIKTAILRFDNNDPNENPFDVTLTGQGKGIPIIATNKNNISFGNVLVGNEESEEIIISNMGEAALSVESVEVGGLNPNNFNLLGIETPFDLQPLQSMTLSVAFVPASDGEKSATIMIQSNDEDNSPLVINLNGRGASSDIELDTTSHDFGEVPVGTRASHTFLISNGGIGDLIIGSYTLHGPGLNQFEILNDPPPLIIPPGRIDQLKVDFVPTAIGEQIATLILSTNDPDESQISLALMGKTLSPKADVDAESLDYTTLMPGLVENQSIFVSNSGVAPLRIDSVVIQGLGRRHFRLANPDIASIIVESNAETEIEVEYAPEFAGEHRAILRLITTDLELPVIEINLSGQSQLMTVDLLNDVAIGEDINVRIAFPREYDLDVKELYYRAAGESEFRIIAMEGDDVMEATIPGVVMGLSGLEYYILVSGNAGEASLPTSLFMRNPLFLPVKFESLEVPLSPSPRTYQMISIPVDLEDASLDAVFSDDYGEYNTSRWRLVRWNNNAYREFPELESDLSGGMGYWLVTNDGASFDIEGGTSTSPSELYPIKLAPGWNQIGNPFAFPIEWPESSIDPRIEAPVSYNGIQFNYFNEVLLPWAGYFVNNLAEDTLEVLLDPSESTLGKATQKQGASPIYTLNFITKNQDGSAIDSHTQVGMVIDGEDILNQWRVSEAPPIGDFLRFSVIEGNNRYATLLKPYNAEGSSWILDLDGPGSRGEVQFSIQQTGQLPEGYEVYLLDLENRNRIFLEDSSFTLPSLKDKENHRLKLILGRQEYVKQEKADISLLPESSVLKQNYPNPFGTLTVIPYQIGESAVVTVEVFNLLGQKVATLLNKNHDPGQYTISWDGQDNSGKQVSSGVYVYNLKVNDSYQFKKMLLVR